MARPRQIPKIVSPDRVLNQVQDNIIAALNPILRTLPDGIGTRPTVSGASTTEKVDSLISALASMGLITDGTT